MIGERYPKFVIGIFPASAIMSLVAVNVPLGYVLSTIVFKSYWAGL